MNQKGKFKVYQIRTDDKKLIDLIQAITLKYNLRFEIDAVKYILYKGYNVVKLDKRFIKEV